jgi:hypothetical protein
MNAPLLARFNAVFRSAIPIPPPAAGYFRTITYDDVDRTAAEWFALLTAAPAPVSASQSRFYGAPPARDYPTLLIREMRMRWLVRKWITRVRERIYTRRSVGADCDLYTTEPVPDDAAVHVRDRATRTRYTFHALTLCRSITSGLRHHSFGIPNPTSPKNPYTNIPWSYTQGMVITEQILMYCARHHVRIPRDVLSFRESDYCIRRYLTAHKRPLSILAAADFLKSDCTYARSTLREIMYDLYDDSADEEGGEPPRRQLGWRTVTHLVCENQSVLPSRMFEQWLAICVDAWLFENCGFLHKHRNYTDLLHAFNLLHSATYAWALRMRGRAPSTAAASTAATESSEEE